MFSNADGISTSSHNFQLVENGTIQVSAAKGTIGLMLERGGCEVGVLLTPNQAAELVASMVSASNACDAHPTNGAAQSS